MKEEGGYLVIKPVPNAHSLRREKMKWKSAVVSSVIVFLFLVSVACAGTKTLTASWQQVLPEPNDLKGWELWYSQDQIGWEKWGDILYVEEHTEYTAEIPFASPSGQRVTWYFRMNSYDTSANYSGWSTIASKTIDFEAPQPPTEFKLTIEVISQ